ncbi:MAG TPA: serine/threonine-protein kinase [Kofleriaceae bacterium]|nr:serine/threonine-protein kinase [Kofleriaceae bacterium]
MAAPAQRFGKYLLLHQVALGGMAEIFLAVEKSVHGGHRFVTIKRIRKDFDRDDEFVQFFLTEGRVSLKCAHPNLPQAYELGQVDGAHYLALEYIHGHTLLDVVREAALGRRALAVSSVVHIGVGLAAALEHAHGLRDVDGRPLRVVHRDVTPQNVMLSVSGAVKLIDFGIVRSSMQTHRTESGVVKGKFSYMAPETLDGDRRFDHRADLFALGVVLHEALTGRSLFRGHDDQDTVERIRSMRLPDLTRLRSDVPASLASVILHALERDPDRRFQTATEMLHALERAAEISNIHHSMTRLRDEVLDRCGVPLLPALPPEIRAMLTEVPARAETSLEEPGFDAPEPPSDQPTAPLDGEPDGPRSQDPTLDYFLRQSGGVRGKRHSTTVSDAELTELLAALER